MPVYNYKARNLSGQIVTGGVESVSEAEASALLEEKQLVVLSLTEGDVVEKKGWNINIGTVKHKDVVIFSRQLSVMISATVPIVQALRILAKQTSNAIFVQKITEMADQVDGGMKLSLAMSKHSKVFSNFFVSMVKSGETSGKLDEVLLYLADQMEKDYDLMSRIKGAMIYPVFIIAGMLIVGFLMMVFVVPKMTAMLKESGQELPFLTKILIGSSDFLKDYWYIIIFGVIFLIIGIKLFVRSKRGKIIFNKLVLKAPVFGELFKKVYIVRFARSLSTLVKGGVPISASLNITSEVVDNEAYKELIVETVKEVEDGNSISTLFSKSNLMPPMLSQMMIIGEKTGKLDEILDRLASFYSREIDSLVVGLTSLIEPLILMIMGVGVGGMVAAIMIPMFKVAQTMGA